MDEKRESIKEEELITQDPEFWNDPKKAELVLKGIKQKKFWVNTYDNLKMSLEDTEVLLIPIFKKSSCTEKRIPSCKSGLISFLAGYKEIFLYLAQKMDHDPASF